MDDVLTQLINTGAATHSISGQKMRTGVSSLPDFMKDATDRNRTSPFAFTGNKFEFRMVGSEDSVGEPNIVLNTIVAEAFSNACDVLEQADNFNVAIHDYIKKLATAHQRIVFNGDGYSEEWVKEAERRGLKNIASMVDAIPALTTEKTIETFEKFHVFNRTELESRSDIEYDTYAKKMNIEAKTMMDMAEKQIIPAVIKYETKLADSINSVKSAVGMVPKTQESLLHKTEDLLNATNEALDQLVQAVLKGMSLSDHKERANYYYEVVSPAMEALRKPVDELEMVVDKELWPMPSYGDMLFEV